MKITEERLWETRIKPITIFNSENTHSCSLRFELDGGDNIKIIAVSKDEFMNRTWYEIYISREEFEQIKKL